jgi:hypothetical protein
MKRHWVYAEGGSRIAYLVFPPCKVKGVLVERHGRPSGGRLGINKTWARSDNSTTGCKPEKISRSGAGIATPVENADQSSGLLSPVIHAPFESVGTHVARNFPHSDLGNKFLVIATVYPQSGRRSTPSPNQEALTVAEVLVITSSENCAYRESYTLTRAVTLGLSLSKSKPGKSKEPIRGTMSKRRSKEPIRDAMSGQIEGANQINQGSEQQPRSQQSEDQPSKNQHGNENTFSQVRVTLQK